MAVTTGGIIGGNRTGDSAAIEPETNTARVAENNGVEVATGCAGREVDAARWRVGARDSDGIAVLAKGDVVATGER